jgi:hypothetical protein
VTEQTCRDWLDREDKVCHDDRISRLQWLANKLPASEYLTFPGGMIRKHLFEEARYCFAYGQYLAAIILGMAYIEHTLAAVLYAIGRSDLERASISELLQESVELGLLTDVEVKNLDHARVLRNPLVHFRRPLWKDSLERRSIAENEQPYDVLEADARHVMEAMFHIVGRHAV